MVIRTSFVCFVVSKTNAASSLTREELTSLRNSVRFVTVELHNVASVLDSILRRTGGAVKGTERDITERRLSDHLNHPALEELFRAGNFPSAPVKKVPERSDFGQSKQTVPSVNEFIMSLIYSGLNFGASVFSFAFDIVSFFAFQSCYLSAARETKVYKPQPGRYYSPVPPSSVHGCPYFTPWNLGGSALYAVLVQSVLAMNVFPVSVSIYTLRTLSLFPLFHIIKQINSELSPAPPVFGLTYSFYPRFSFQFIQLICFAKYYSVRRRSLRLAGFSTDG